MEQALPGHLAPAQIGGEGFTQFLRRMLLPYDRDCPDCQQRREASLTLVMPPPKVLLIRYSWSISFPVNEKDLTFCGVPEMVGERERDDACSCS